MTKNMLMGIGAFGICAVLLGSVSASAFFPQDVKDAITTGDYDAFQTAISQVDNEKVKDRLSNLSENDFTQVSEKVGEIEQVKDAIENGTYQDFQNVAPERLLNKIDSEDAFNELKETKAEFSIIKESIDEAIINNDFDAFKEAQEDMQELREETLSQAGFSGKRRGFKKDISDEKLEEKFNKAVEQYQEDGTLPGENKTVKKALRSVLRSNKRGGFGLRR